MKQFFLAVSLFAFALTGMAQTTADSLALVNADWQVTNIKKGLVCKKAVFESLYGVPQEISILEVSPKKFKIDVQEHNAMERTSEVSKRHNATAALNGTFYNMKHGFSVSYLQQKGVVIDTTSTTPTQANGALYIKRGKIKEIMRWDKNIENKMRKKPKKSVSIMAAGPVMLIDGEVCSTEGLSRSFCDTKHPRSAVALTKRGKTILLIVVDGRRKGKCEGVSIAEFTHMIQVLGGVNARNVDGGGSSTLWSEDMPGDGVINTPSDKSGERKVANSIGVYEK